MCQGDCGVRALPHTVIDVSGYVERFGEFLEV